MTEGPRIPGLPEGLVCYRRTDTFTRDTIPKALLSTHTVKSGVWGVLRVERGRVRYCGDDEAGISCIVSQGDRAVIPPLLPHHVELLDADSAFQIEFYRRPV